MSTPATLAPGDDETDEFAQRLRRHNAPLPYGHPNLATFLASQLYRRLKAFRVMSLDELQHALAQ